MIFTVQDCNLDLINELHRSKEYWAWKDPEVEFIIRPQDHLSPLSCPIGSVEFCENYYQYVFQRKPRPLNIPESLFEYSGRLVQNNPKDLNQFTDDIFIKSRLKTKSSFNGFIKKNDFLELTKDNIELSDIQVSSKIPEIESEFRVFVYKKEIIDMKQYLGDPFGKRPNKIWTETIIGEFKDQPVSYTLDLYLKPGSSIPYVMEVHNFYGCGLYGFDDHHNYPYMLWRWFKEFSK